MKSQKANRNLEVASFSIQCVNNVLNGEEDKANCKNKYKTLVKKIPTLIQRNGYISTLAFCYSKGTTEHNKVLNNIIDWSIDNDNIKDLLPKYNFKNSYGKYLYDKYIEAIVNLDQKKYRTISKEVMILFGWIKRFSDGMIEDDK